jgi:hypothetical protein
MESGEELTECFDLVFTNRKTGADDVRTREWDAPTALARVLRQGDVANMAAGVTHDSILSDKINYGYGKVKPIPLGRIDLGTSQPIDTLDSYLRTSWLLLDCLNAAAYISEQTRDCLLGGLLQEPWSPSEVPNVSGL